MVTEKELAALPRRRSLINSVTRYIVALGGAAVIGAIALIFFYLLWVIAPVFVPASLEVEKTFEVSAGDVRHLDVSESGEFGLRILSTGDVEFISLDQEQPKISSRSSLGFAVERVKPLTPMSNYYALVDADGTLRVVSASYPVSFEDDQRVVRPSLTQPFEDSELDVSGALDFDLYFESGTALLAVLRGDHVELTQYRDVEEGFALEMPRSTQIDLDAVYDRVWIGPRGQWLILLNESGRLELYDVKRPRRAKLLSTTQVVPEDGRVDVAEAILGRYSLLIGQGGDLQQWFVLRDEYGYRFEQVRGFEYDKPLVKIIPEHRRKGFIALDAGGTAHLGYTTSNAQLASHPVGLPGDTYALSPRGKQLLAAAPDGAMRLFVIDNEHPDITWSALWDEIWYEGYEAPVHSWQSSSADNDFEPKFSLMPLLFGTLKAAFYAMLFATPLALMGAIYTAYFMAPSMRKLVKPGIEIMAALPTVVLGFLAGLWLAPIIEANLSAVLSLILVLPVGLMLLAWLWSLLPKDLTRRFDGWYGLVAVVPIISMVAIAFELGPHLEVQFFGGDSRAWFLNELGLSYDQRNALVVGLAMGLAVVPTIFSIAEDAIYGVPRHLVNGSLALGATPWQTLVRVVLLTASPGMFSAVMIGLGRAVGETMIVLMATGNTPIMDLNIFEGMRTFAANIAVELPESEVGSSHYRILFLTAMVLFLLTFAFNTVAEVVRQRLRARYGSL